MGYRSTFKDSDEFFLDLSRVDRGQIYEFSLSDMTLIQKKNFRRFPKVQKSKRTRLQIVNDLKKLVIKSVGRRLESDVPIAICLSGGIDSSIIAAIARRDFGISLESYTLESTDERYSEAASARKIANYLDIPHHIVKMTPHNFFERMERLTRYHEAPIATISYYIQSFLTEQIHRDGFKVSLMGSGADEIFTGYYDHHLAYLAGLKKGDAKIYEEAVRNWTEKILPLVRNPIFQNLNYYVDFPDRRDHLYEGSEELSLVCLTPQNLKLIDEDFGLSPLRNRMMNELFYEVIPVILHEDDRNSMMNSIENRSPFLSYEILEFMISVPDVHLINGGLAKSLLREAFIDYLPEEILFSPRKIGFNANFSELCDVNSKEFQELFMNKSDFWKNVDRNAVIQTLAKLGTEDKYNKMSFAIVASKVFFDCFNNTK
jgi:asparagine synthase (glutamine-hydrolysing)